MRPALLGVRTGLLERGLPRLRAPRARQRRRPAASCPGVARRGDRGDAARRTAAAQRAGADQDPPPPHFLSRRRSRDPDLERGVRLRHASGAQAALEILEFANSQLLEFRYYDELLDRELASIYALLQHPKWYDEWVGSRYARAARKVHALFIDVNELTDRTENTLKFIGDIYAARLFGLVADRLGLGTWKANVQEKLKTLDDVYRFAVEQSTMSRGQFMELTIVFILVLELVLFFMGVMK